MPPRPKKPSPTTPKKSAPATGGAWIWIAVVAVVLVAAGWFILRPHPAAPPQTQTEAKVPTYAPTAVVEDEKKVFAQYAGSGSCRECHADAYQQWARSNHGLAERLPVDGMDRKAFDPARKFKHGTQQTSLRVEGTNFTVICPGFTATNESHTVARVIGNDPLRQFLVPFPGGRFQTLEATYDPHRNEWYDVYGEEDRKPGEWGHWTGAA